MFSAGTPCTHIYTVDGTTTDIDFVVLGSNSDGQLVDDASASLASARDSPYIFTDNQDEVSIWIKFIQTEGAKSILGYSFKLEGATQVRVRIGVQAGQWQDVASGQTVTIDDINEQSNDIEIIIRRKDSEDIKVSGCSVQICEKIATQLSSKAISEAPTTSSVPSTSAVVTEQPTSSSRATTPQERTTTEITKMTQATTGTFPSTLLSTTAMQGTTILQETTEVSSVAPSTLPSTTIPAISTTAEILRTTTAPPTTGNSSKGESSTVLQ